jgi:nucleoside-diphosphate-sugar epimerase
MHRILITGATGCIGRQVTLHALSLGATVRALTIPGDTLALPANVERVTGSMLDVPSLDLACRDVHSIVHLAAFVHAVPRGDDDLRAMRAINVDGTKALLESAKTAGVRQVLFASSVGVYRRHADTEFTDETGAVHSPTPYIATKLEGEAMVREAGGTVLRVALTFGEGDRGNFGLLIKQARAGLYVCVGGGGNVKSLAFSRHIGERVARIARSSLRGRAAPHSTS